MPTDIFSALGVIVSGLSALLAGYYAKRTIDHAQKAQLFAAQADEHAKHANVISANTWLDQYLCNVRLWADEVCDCISKALHASNLNGSLRDEMYFEIVSRLSSLIDRGRWFFPNQWSDEYGQNKEPAYRGLRQPILDHVVHSYDIIKLLQSAESNPDLTKLINAQRLFVSEVQQVLNPRRREKEMARVNEEFAISEKLRDLT